MSNEQTSNTRNEAATINITIMITMKRKKFKITSRFLTSFFFPFLIWDLFCVERRERR